MRQLKYIYVFLVLTCAYCLQAQDPHFSQITASPLNINPAFTGLIEGQYRVNAMYRDQWSTIGAKYRTASVAADFRYHITGNDFYAFGVKLLSDQAGDGVFKQNYVHVSVSYLKKLFGNRRGYSQYISGGVQGGIGQHSIDWGKLWFGNQYDLSSFNIDNSLPTGENEIVTNSGEVDLFLDVNAGLLWYSVFNEATSVYFGISMSHLNQPRVSLFSNGVASLSNKYNIHAGGEFPLSRSVSILPAVRWLNQSPHQQFVLGSSFRYNQLGDADVSLRFGLYTRITEKFNDGLHNDAFILTVAYEFSDFIVGLSYDLTTSSLANANDRQGAFELSASYIFPYTNRNYKVACPKL